MFRRAIIIATAVFIASSALFGLFVQPASAATVPDLYLAETVRQAAVNSTERNALALCLGGNSNGMNAVVSSDALGQVRFDRSQGDVAGYSWLPNNQNISVQLWYEGHTKNEGTKCNDLNVSKIAADLGLGDGVSAACTVGFVRANGSNCVNGDGDFEWPTTGSIDQKSSLSKQDVLAKIDTRYNGAPGDLGKDYSGPQYYLMAMDILTDSTKCSAVPLSLVSDNNASDKAKAGDKSISIVNGDGGNTKVYYQINGDKNKEMAFRNGLGNDRNVVGGTCNDMITVANENAAAYAAWVKKNPSGTATNTGTCDEYAKQQSNTTSKQKSIAAACNAGLSNRDKATYCADTYPTDFNNPSDNFLACNYGHDKAIDPNASTDGADAEDKTSCAVVGIGWFVCPVMNFMAMIADTAYSALANLFLTVDVNTVKAAQPSWEKFRDVANVAFVIAVVLIVYSQITSFGISNYGIKRMLPRLAVAALLVNTSFFICMIAVDVSNLIGYAIPNFLNSSMLSGNVSSDGSIPGAIVAGLSWVVVIGGVLGGAVAIALALSAPVLIAAVLAVVMIVFILLARQALIILLIVVSPLAFVAYLLPNTEQWFKKWYKMFFTMLMLFPIIGVVFGASQLAAETIYKASGSNAGDYMNGLVALAISAIPFFVVPGLLKGALNATGALGQKMQGIANKASGRVGGKVKSSSKLGTGLAEMKQFREKKRAINYAKNRGTGLIGAVGRVAGGKGFNEKAVTRANQLELSEHHEDVKVARDNLEANSSYDRIYEIAQGKNIEGVSSVEREAAIDSMMAKGNATERRQILYSAGGMDDKQRKAVVNGAFAKGDGGVYGSSTLGMLMDVGSMKVDGDPAKKAVKDKILNNTSGFLDEGATKRINSGEMSAETFTRDTYTSGYVKSMAANATPQAQSALAQSLSDYMATDQSKRATSTTLADASAVINSAPTPPTPPVVPQGGQLPNNQQPTPQQQNNQPNSQPQQPQNNGNQLNIPHNNVVNNNTVNNNTTNTQTMGQNVPGTSSFTQTPSGLYVPPSAANGSASSSTPPTPTVPNPSTPPNNSNPTNP